MLFNDQIVGPLNAYEKQMAPCATQLLHLLASVCTLKDYYQWHHCLVRVRSTLSLTQKGRCLSWEMWPGCWGAWWVWGGKGDTVMG